MADKDNRYGLILEPARTSYLSAVNRSQGPMAKAAEAGEKGEERPEWTGKLDFLLSCISYAVGLGNVWRFPYLCYKNGGGAFLVPYVIMLALAGMPLFYLELAFGQFSSLGPVSIWRISPMFKGVGYAMVVISVMVGIYYNVVIAYTLYYLFASFTATLPWLTCNNPWNTAACVQDRSVIAANATNSSGLLLNATANATANLTGGKPVSASEEYWRNGVLQLSEGFNAPGYVVWYLCLCLLLAWLLVFFCLIKGVQSAGKVVYFTSTFPYIVLTILLIRCSIMDGAIDGVLFYVTPDFSRLADAEVWGDAGIQIFFSLSVAWGGLISMASYNKFSQNCYRDAIVVSITNCATSIYAGFVIFSILGFMANEMGVDVKDVADKGSGLAFVTYPEAVARLPISPLWSALFFFMLLSLGMGTQFAIIQTIVTSIIDEFPERLMSKRMLVTGLCCLVFFLLGLPCITQGGNYMVELMNDWAAGLSLMVIGLIEVIAIAWIYGTDAFFSDIEMMIGSRPNRWWWLCWKFLTPIVLFIILLFYLIGIKPAIYGGRLEFPESGQALGWLMTLTSLVVIPLPGIYYVCRAEGTFMERVRKVMKPLPEWGPALEENRELDERYSKKGIPLADYRDADNLPNTA